MPSHSWKKAPAELIALFEAVKPNGPFIESRQMFGYPCFFVNGNLAGGLHEDHFLLRLSENDRAELAALGGHVFSPFPGRTMKEYAVLPNVVLADRAALVEWINKAVSYTSSLPEKKRSR